MTQELRYNPLMKWWVMISSLRQKRPLLPQSSCPFCPGSGKVPAHYEVHKYDNDFPILSPSPPPLDQKLNTPLYRNSLPHGKCEVILYTSNHTANFYELTDPQLLKLVDLWIQRVVELSKKQEIKYIFIFENKGEVIGTTMSHPHGQIYAYPFIPPRIASELESSSEYYKEFGKCIFCDLVEKEVAVSKRIVLKNDSFTAFVPFFAEYPYQIFLVPNRHFQSIDELKSSEKIDLVLALKKIVRGYDSLFKTNFPYMMCFHQKPCDDSNYDYYHFHIEFYPPMRNETTQKYNASSETGAGVHGNPTSPEEKAKELKRVCSDPHCSDPH